MYDLLRNSTLATGLTGSVYRQGYRPPDSRLEDAIVIYTAGVPSDVQKAIVTVNIYVANIDAGAAGISEKNGARCGALELAAARWVEGLQKTGFRFELNDVIHTTEAPEINQHFVVVSLLLKFTEQ